MRWSSAFSLFLLSVFLLAVGVVGTNENVRRQQSSTDSPATPGATSSSAPSSSKNPTPPSSTPSPTPTSTAAPSTTTQEDTSTAQDSTQETSIATSSSPTPTRNVVTRTTSPTSVRVVTNIVTVSGSVVEQTETTTNTDATSATATRAPAGLDNQSGGSGSSGLTRARKKIIIGVVVGVGGAIILGGLAVVAWRLGRRRNSRPGDEDDLMNSGTAVGSSSHETSTANSPFKTTLDQYHSPGPVNQASNF